MAHGKHVISGEAVRLKALAGAFFFKFRACGYNDDNFHKHPLYNLMGLGGRAWESSVCQSSRGELEHKLPLVGHVKAGAGGLRPEQGCSASIGMNYIFRQSPGPSGWFLKQHVGFPMKDV